MAQAPAAPTSGAAVPRGKPDVSGELRDPEFGVSRHAAGLQRRVEMYQWRRDGTRYATAWSQQRIDSSAFDPAHANPKDFPVRTRYWIATRVRLDGKPLSEDVLKTFGTWRAFRPGFSSLPGNLAATFQPEGDGLSSSENPLDPRIGDLRITWHALELPPLAGKVVLESGAWVPVEAAGGIAGVQGAARPTAPAAQSRSSTNRDPRWKWVIGTLLALSAVVTLARRRRERGTR